MLSVKYFWKSSDGRVNNIKDLSDNHLSNIINMLERKLREAKNPPRDYYETFEELNKQEKIKELEEDIEIFEKERIRRLEEKIESKSQDGKHESTMSERQRKILIGSLYYTFDYDYKFLAIMTDPELYNLFKKEISKV